MVRKGGEEDAFHWIKLNSALILSHIKATLNCLGICYPARCMLRKLEDQTILETDLLYFGLSEDSRDKDIVAGYGFKLANGLVIIFYNAGNFAKLYFNGFPSDLPNGFVLRWEKNNLK